MKIFITGESGVIPTEICKQAYQFGHTVVNTNLEITLYDYLKRFQAFKVRKPEIDFTDPAILKAAFEILKPDIVIHSGAFVGTDFCDAQKDMATIVNVYGTQNIIELCNQYDIPLVYFSTTAIFDPRDYSVTKPITEETKICPMTLYGVTKFAGELLVKNTAKVPTIIVRPVFGFGDYPNDLHSALTKMIYTFVGEQNNDLLLKLSPRIAKNYFRVENIAYCVLKLINKNIWDIAINVGENYTERKDWTELYNIIYKISARLCEKHYSSVGDDEEEDRKVDQYNIEWHKNFRNVWTDKIHWVPQEDYLHWHNIDNSALTSLIGKQIYITPLETGIEETIKSVLANQQTIPYWL